MAPQEQATASPVTLTVRPWGRTRYVEIRGDDAVRVMAEVVRVWTETDPWLRSAVMPRLERHPGGGYFATVTVESAE